jgi:dihydropteroate synthase
MGVLNVTPDSFSDGGQFFSVDKAMTQARAMAEAGADIIDVGGESTRPGATAISASEESQRVLPIVKTLGQEGIRCLISIDTTKSEVAQKALDEGASIINDISALRGDQRMAGVVRDAGAGLVLMHMQGSPQTMQNQPAYKDVVAEVSHFLAGQIAVAEEAGIQRDQIAVDPGIGFGKTVSHNLMLLSRLDALLALGCPVLVGTSRKSFIGQVLNRPSPGDRLWGTAATIAWAVAHGASIVRVHDVTEMRDVARMTRALVEARGSEHAGMV